MLTGVSALACVAMVGTKVNAAAGDIVVQNFVDVGWDKNSTSVSEGWVLSETNGTSSFTVDSVSYSITKISANKGIITSPKLADNAIASKADISVTVGTTATSSAAPFTVNALSSGAIVATGNMYTPASKALGSATTT